MNQDNAHNPLDLPTTVLEAPQSDLDSLLEAFWVDQGKLQGLQAVKRGGQPVEWAALHTAAVHAAQSLRAVAVRAQQDADSLLIEAIGFLPDEL